MKIVALSPLQHEHANEIESVIQLFQNGLSTYHLRKPFYKFSTMINYLNQIPEKYHNRIVLHSHHSLIKKFNLEGVHYTWIHLQPTFTNWWNEKRLASRIKNKTQTASCKKLADLHELGDRHYSYVFLSSVFDPLTGKYQSGYYEDAIKNSLKRTAVRVIAMGGVDINRARKIRDLGFYGMALNNCLWGKENPVEEFNNIITHCREHGMFTE